MKKLLVFLVLAFLYSTGNCQDYETIVDTTKQWSVVSYSFVYNPYPHEERRTAETTTYRFRVDTLINDYHFLFLEECHDSLFQVWQRSEFMMRDDSAGRVYVHDYNQEKLLYNYNVEAEDTIWIPNISNFTLPDEMTIVNSIGIEVIAGKERKIVYYGGMFGLYIKGFGTYGGPLGLFYNSFVGDFGMYVSCFYQNDTLLYHEGESCYVHYNHIGINETKKGKTKIYPNPASNELTISFDKNTNAEFFLYSIYGRLLESKKLFSNNITLSLSGYSDGIYYYSIKSKKKIIKNGLLIIKK